MGYKQTIQKWARKVGFDLVRYSYRSHPVARRHHILTHGGFTVVLDVGANTGQFAQHIREDFGYCGRIVSFEPLNSAFQVLRERSRGDGQWETMNYAIGDAEEKKTIHVAGNSYSSSLLDMLPSHERSAPGSAYVASEEIQVRTLDSVFGDLCSPKDKVYLKLDTQGYEARALEGAGRSLPRIDTIQVEMSLTPLYRDGPLFHEICTLLCQKGYTLVSIEQSFADANTGQLLQVDGVFRRL